MVSIFLKSLAPKDVPAFAPVISSVIDFPLISFPETKNLIPESSPAEVILPF